MQEPSRAYDIQTSRLLLLDFTSNIHHCLPSSTRRNQRGRGNGDNTCTPSRELKRRTVIHMPCQPFSPWKARSAVCSPVVGPQSREDRGTQTAVHCRREEICGRYKPNDEGDFGTLSFFLSQDVVLWRQFLGILEVYHRLPFQPRSNCSSPFSSVLFYASFCTMS